MCQNRDMKKKLPTFIWGSIGIGSLIVSFFIAKSLNLPGSFICDNGNSICNVPLLGKIIDLLTNPTLWITFIIYGIFFSIFTFIIKKKGYKI